MWHTCAHTERERPLLQTTPVSALIDWILPAATGVSQPNTASINHRCLIGISQNTSHLSVVSSSPSHHLGLFCQTVEGLSPASYGLHHQPPLIKLSLLIVNSIELLLKTVSVSISISRRKRKVNFLSLSLRILKFLCTSELIFSPSFTRVSSALG